MELIKANGNDYGSIFSYWTEIGCSIPYFFKVTEEKWKDSMFNEKFMGRPVFKEIETYYVSEGSKVVGFIQFGQPCFHYDSEGNLILMPNIGVIRNLYFNKDMIKAGELLINAAEEYFRTNNFDEVFAFYHAMGLSCNARHGKLHESMSHVEAVLKDHGFATEHENIYYTVNMRALNKDTSPSVQVRACEENQNNEQSYIAILDDKAIGGAEVRYLKEATGGATSDTAYLGWIWVESEYKGQGLGTELLYALQKYLRDNGYTYMHLDTANNNYTAQRFYDRNGFTNHGVTKSYFRKNKL